MKRKLIIVIVSAIMLSAVVLLTSVIVMTGCNHKCEIEIRDTYPIWLEENKHTPQTKEPMFQLSDSMMDSLDMGCGE
mgnify:CR=1 FL=1